MHALRGSGDDYDLGNEAAIAGTRQAILELVAKGQGYVDSDTQIITTSFFLDFYGRVDVQVYAPAFMVGQAAHVLQDTFSHTLRDGHDDYKTIVHVLNYIDAIGTNLNETRDGLAHSNTMDNCDREEMSTLAEHAALATAELLSAAREQYSGREPDAVLAVLDKWVIQRSGCTWENDFCDNSEGLRFARINQTKPYIEEFFGCGTTRSRGSTLAVVLFLLVIFGIRGYRKRGRASTGSKASHR
jgi:hypothetical protein